MKLSKIARLRKLLFPESLESRRLLAVDIPSGFVQDHWHQGWDLTSSETALYRDMIRQSSSNGWHFPQYGPRLEATALGHQDDHDHEASPWIETSKATLNHTKHQQLDGDSFIEKGSAGAHDSDTLIVDPPEPFQKMEEAVPQAAVGQNQLVSAADTFKLHSLPGANHTIYLDFDGHTTTGTTWNSSSGVTSIVSPPYDPSNDGPGFSSGERQLIQRIWQRVAEDFSPFQVNVTTEEPGAAALMNSGGADATWGTRVVITPDDWDSCGCGGFAYLNSFDDSDDEPVFVFNTSEIGVSAATTHEVGHALGLEHDGVPGDAYYDGHGAGDTAWGPIMGSGYYTNMTTWDQGQYYQANNQQNDWAVITSFGFGFRSDLIGGTTGTAKPLNIVGTNTGDVGLMDVDDFGIIELGADLDFFEFQTGAGNINLTIDSYVQETFVSNGGSFTRTVEGTPVGDQGSNLDIEATIYDELGQFVASSNPLGDLNAAFTNHYLDAGTYFLAVDGIGEGNWGINPPTGYDQSVSRGQYRISGTIISNTVDSGISDFTSSSLAGAHAYEALQSGSISQANEVDSSTVVLEAGQTLSVNLKSGSTLQPTVALLFGGNTLASATASTPGEPIALQGIAIDESGTYTLQVTGQAGSTGFYQNKLALNANLETEGALPTPIDSSYLPLGSGRFAVLGLSAPPAGQNTYTFVKNNAPSAFVDISSTGTALSLGDDGRADITSSVGNAAFPAGTVSVANNGGIIVGAGANLAYTNAGLPAPIGHALLPFWDDIDSDTGNVYWEERLVGGIDTLIVQWHNRPHYSNSGSVTFQVQLFESGPIAARFAYQDVVFGNPAWDGGASATIGFQDNSGNAFQYSFNSPTIANGDSLDLLHPVQAVDVDEFTMDLGDYVGQTLDIVLKGGEAALDSEILKLFAPNGALVATATSTPLGSPALNYDLAILNHVVADIGNNNYRLELSSTRTSDYTLLASNELAFDTESNGLTSDALRPISVDRNAIGYVALSVAGTVEPDDFSAGATLDTIDPSVTLSNATTGGSIYSATASSFTPPTGSRVFAASPTGASGFRESSNGMKAVFAQPMRIVSIDAGSDDSSDVTRMRAYDAADNLLTSVTSSGLASGAKETLTISRDKADIAYVVIGGVGNDISPIDNLTYSNDEDQLDLYSMTLSAGDAILLRTGTAFSGPGAPNNDLDPSLTVLAADGTTVLASDSDSLDGKNASLSFIAPVSGSYFVRISAEAGAGDYIIHLDEAPLPEVKEVLLNGGDSARSQLTSVSVVFDAIVDHGLLADAFALTNIDTNAAVTSLVVTPSDINGETHAFVTFGSGASVVDRLGSGLLGNSLANGNYRLEVDASKVVSPLGVTMDSNYVFGGQTFGEANNDDFFRLLGDTNSDGVLNGIDLNAIIPALFNPPGYREDLDTNGDGVINGIDLNALIPTIFGQGRL